MIQEATAALASLKAAVDIAKGLNALQVDVAVKTKTSDLLSSLIDVQSSMLDLQCKLSDILQEKEELRSEVARLKSSAAAQDTLRFRDKMYWKEGDPTPFCPTCWENERKQIHLTGPHRRDEGTQYWCTVCENDVWT